MPERNGQSDTSKSDLDELESKLKAARARREGSKQKDEDRDNSMLGMAWRLSTELLAAVLVGFLLGYGVDTLLGSRPWGTLVGLGFGIAAGFMGVFRTAAAMDAKNADIPIGNDLPPESDDVN